MDYIKHLRSMVGKERVIMVAAGALVFDKENRLLLQLRSDHESWGIPGGFMELEESVQESAIREVYEETGLQLGALKLFGIYSGRDTTFQNGDQVSLVLILFRCDEFEGELVKQNEESLDTKFFPLNDLPTNLFSEHQMVFDDLLSGKEVPILG